MHVQFVCATKMRMVSAFMRLAKGAVLIFEMGPIVWCYARLGVHACMDASYVFRIHFCRHQPVRKTHQHICTSTTPAHNAHTLRGRRIFKPPPRPSSIRVHRAHRTIHTLYAGAAGFCRCCRHFICPVCMWQKAQSRRSECIRPRR